MVYIHVVAQPRQKLNKPEVSVFTCAVPGDPAADSKLTPYWGDCPSNCQVFKVPHCSFQSVHAVREALLQMAVSEDVKETVGTSSWDGLQNPCQLLLEAIIIVASSAGVTTSSSCTLHLHAPAAAV